MKHSGKLAWLVAVLFLGVYEAWAILTHHETLSHAMYAMTQAFGVLPFLAGVIVGGLAVHFWWRWEPGVKGGG